MAVADIKVSLRKRGVTDFGADGFRMLPITKKEYVLGLLGADGRLDPSLIPAFLYDARQYVGILDLDEQSTIDIDGVVSGSWGGADVSSQGSYLEVTTAGFLTNSSASSADYEIIGAGDEGDNTFPIHLEVGDYLVLAKYNVSAPTYSFAIVNRSHAIADTAQYGVTKLYAGIDSASNVLAGTAGAVKTAYDLANSKEDSIGTKGTAFNKNFGSSGGTVAEGNHQHTAFDATLSGVGAQFLRSITIINGIVTAVALDSVSLGALGGGAIDDGVNAVDVVWSGSYINGLIGGLETGIGENMDNIAIADKRGLKYYTSVANADAGGHNAGDIVAVLEA